MGFMFGSFGNRLAMLALALLAFSGCSGGGVVAAGNAPTLQPTETARPLVTPTLVPIPPPMDIPTVDWSDLSAHRKAMKAGFEGDVDDQEAAKVPRYLIIAKLTFSPDAVIQGGQRVRYTNRSKDTLNYVVFRLYANTPALGGRINVTRVLVNDQQVEPSFSDLGSVMGVPLSTPLNPGETIEFVIDFNTTMTRGLDTSYGRFGYVNNVVSSTAWYPILSVYEERSGWWQERPSGQGDPVYSETGLYDVHLTVPGNVVVAASGIIIDETRNDDGTVTYRDVTGPMREHAFQASERYIIAPVEVEGTRINIVHYREGLRNTVDGTEVATQYSIDSVKAFNKRFGEYPYRELDIVQNPTPSGVEFPGLVQIAQRSWVRGNDFLEKVIAHEIGHQWFYALIGNNQISTPWLDESLTSYTEFVYMRETYADTPKRAQDYIDGYSRRYTGYVGAGNPDQALDLPVKSYNGFAYGAIIYTKGPLFIVELERQLGQEVVYKALAEYFRRFKYKVARTEDIKAVFEEVSGKDLTPVFDKWVEGK
jgi:Peptidase family M1 domain